MRRWLAIALPWRCPCGGVGCRHYGSKLWLEAVNTVRWPAKLWIEWTGRGVLLQPQFARWPYNWLLLPLSPYRLWWALKVVWDDKCWTAARYAERSGRRITGYLGGVREFWRAMRGRCMACGRRVRSPHGYCPGSCIPHYIDEVD